MIFGGSILNELFRQSEVAPFLKLLGELFPPKCIFVVADYFGKLGHIKEIRHDLMQNLLHDVCQAISGQMSSFIPKK